MVELWKPLSEKTRTAAATIRSRTSCSWAALTRGTSTPENERSLPLRYPPATLNASRMLDTENGHSLSCAPSATPLRGSSDVHPLGRVRLPASAARGRRWPSSWPSRAGVPGDADVVGPVSSGGWLDATSESADVVGAPRHRVRRRQELGHRRVPFGVGRRRRDVAGLPGGDRHGRCAGLVGRSAGDRRGRLRGDGRSDGSSARREMPPTSIIELDVTDEDSVASWSTTSGPAIVPPGGYALRS